MSAEDELMSLVSAREGSPLLGQDALIRRAIALSWFTVGYNLLEGAVSIGFGVSDESVSLAGFGSDSLIEVASAALVLWRFKGESGQGARLTLERERKATFGIGLLFVLLACVTGAASIYQLTTLSHPDTTLPGLVISALSLSFMVYLWRAKLSVGQQLGSTTVLKDAACSRACIQLSLILFVGSIFFLLMPQLWWVDTAAALIITALIGKEGFETLRAARSPEFSGGSCCGCDD